MCQPPYALFEVFTGKAPFSGETPMRTTIRIVNKWRPGRPNHPNFTEPLWALTRKCWNQKPKDRLNIRKVIEVLKELSAFGASFEQRTSHSHIAITETQAKSLKPCLNCQESRLECQRVLQQPSHPAGRALGTRLPK